MTRRVLICDDDIATLRIATVILEEQGYEVLLAASGADAVEIAAREQPDAILLDLLMPEKNGWETISELKSNVLTRHIPVIILSLLSPEEAELVRDSYVGWVQKPIRADDLRRALATVTGQRERRPSILVVEDNPVDATVLVSMFRQDGLDVIHAPSGEVALLLTRLIVPDLMLLDVALPEIDGFAVVAAMRADATLCKVPVVVYTARDVDASERARLELGTTFVFTKSRISFEELEQRVLQLLPVGSR